MPSKRNGTGMFFEDYHIGLKIQTAGRTISEADINGFARLSGDFNQIHTDVEYSKTTPFGQRIGHGLLGLSIASGLISLTGLLEKTVIAFREIENWKFINPIFIGDTVTANLEVIELKPMRRLGGGLVKIDISVINQENKTTMKGVWSVLVAGNPNNR